MRVSFPLVNIMKVLVDCSRLRTGGGIQVGLGVLANACRSREHQWYVAASRQLADELGGEEKEHYACFATVGERSGLWSRLHNNASELARIEEAVKPDVVFTVFGPTMWRARAPHVIGFALPTLIYPTERASLLKQCAIRQRCRRRMADAYARIQMRGVRHWIVETSVVRERLHTILGVPRGAVFVVPNAYSPMFAEEVLRPRTRSGDTFRIIVPSAYYVHKNLECVPRVAYELARLTARPFEFVLTIPGTASAWKEISRVAMAVGMNNRIRTVGNVAHREIAGLYRDADAVFLPTLLECSTAVYPESFMARVPLVTSDRDFARALCGEGAAYVDPYSASDAAASLSRIIDERGYGESLVEAGAAALRLRYPSPEAKWLMQLECLERVALQA